MAELWELCTVTSMHVHLVTPTKHEHYTIADYLQFMTGKSPSLKSRLFSRDEYDAIMVLLADGWEPVSYTRTDRQKATLFRRKISS
jgi:hypothetical protein